MCFCGFDSLNVLNNFDLKCPSDEKDIVSSHLVLVFVNEILFHCINQILASAAIVLCLIYCIDIGSKYIFGQVLEFYNRKIKNIEIEIEDKTYSVLDKVV